jgi:uncharacterized membrane protein YfcA
MVWHSVDWHFAIAGFIVGALVGVTGLGGGSLMTPILVLLFGVSPATAVGTDLLFAAATKTVGSFVHGFNKTIEWTVVRRLAAGSLPAAALSLFALTRLHMSAGGARTVITTILALALLLTAGVLIARDRISARYAERLHTLDKRSVAALTTAMGAVLGIVVTFSSVGAGAIGVTALVLLYPRIPMARIVGSDIAHAVPLTLVAGVGHGAMGSLDPHALLSLLVGSFPGIFVGSWVSSRTRDVTLRYILAGVLIIVGTRLAFDIFGPGRPDIAAVGIIQSH